MMSYIEMEHVKSLSDHFEQLQPYSTGCENKAKCIKRHNVPKSAVFLNSL